MKGDKLSFGTLVVQDTPALGVCGRVPFPSLDWGFCSGMRRVLLADTVFKACRERGAWGFRVFRLPCPVLSYFALSFGLPSLLSLLLALLFVAMEIFLSLSLSVHICLYLFFPLSRYPLACCLPAACLFVCLSILYVCVCLSLPCLSVCLSLYLSLSVCLSFCLSVSLSPSLSVSLPLPKQSSQSARCCVLRKPPHIEWESSRCQKGGTDGRTQQGVSTEATT